MDYHGKIDLVEDDSEDSGNHEPSTKRAKRSRKSLNDHHSDEGSSKSSKSSRFNIDLSMDVSQDSVSNTSTRTRQKNKQNTQQQLLEEQQRVEKRVQQEQMKLKQQELMQKQKAQDELRQQQLRSSSDDICNLRTNPNISMRELFPGEEEMGLHVNLPFANSWRTPDGWTKVTSTVQYDEPTRKLWEELQKPYGNQSSFLRHLLLLEKYFRAGDLLLTPNANTNAITYAESVQHRLQAYDNIPPRAVSISQILPKNTSTQSTAMDLASSKTATTISTSKAVTISKVNATPKPPNPSLTITAKPNANANANANESTSNSLLKSNVTQVGPKTRGYTVTTEPINGDKLDSVRANNAVVSNNTSTPKTKNPGLPPELICIASNEKSSGSSVPHSYQHQMQLTLQQQISMQHQNSLLLSQQTKQLLQNLVPPALVSSNANNTTPIASPKKQTSSSTATTTTTTTTPANTTSTNKSPNNTSNNASAVSKANAIRLADALTEAERRESKNWRPTLMPVSTEKIASDAQLYQTADGRKLPYLVQVQSGGKPYMISIHDYNRMCILRRERLLKDHPEVLKNKSPTSQPASAAVTNQKNHTTAAATPLTAANSITNNANAKPTIVDVDKLHKPSANANNSNHGQISNKVQVPNKILEQNSLIPIQNSKTNENSLLRFNVERFSKSKSSLLKSNAVAASQSKSSVPQPIVSQTANIPASVVATSALMPKLPIPLTSALTHSNIVSITSTPSIAAMLGMAQVSTPSPPIQIIPNQPPPITITNVSSGNSNSANQSNVSSLEALFRTTSQVTTTPSTMWQWAEQLNKSNNIIPIDTSATSILSKIPKSLTVIPQQKNISKGADE